MVITEGVVVVGLLLEIKDEARITAMKLFCCLEGLGSRAAFPEGYRGGIGLMWS